MTAIVYLVGAFFAGIVVYALDYKHGTSDEFTRWTRRMP